MPYFDNDDSNSGGPTVIPTSFKAYLLPFQVHQDDEDQLQVADALRTLRLTQTFPGITGTFYITLSKNVPVYP